MNELLATQDLDANEIARLQRAYRLARWAKSHDGIRAHVTRTGSVLLSDRDGALCSVRPTNRGVESARNWLGY